MSVITGHAVRGSTLVHRVKCWAETNPSTPAYIFWSPAGRRVLSRGDVLDLSSRFAYRLTQHGVKPKDVVCVSLPNSPERVVVEFGIHLAGAVSMNGQILRADGEDLIVSLNKAKCSFIVLDPAQTPGAWMICKHIFDSYQMYDTHAEIRSKRIPSLTRAFISKLGGSGDSFLKTLSEEGKLLYEDSCPQDTCTIFTTSGSTGYSKLVPHSHETLLTALNWVCEMLHLNQGTKFFNNSLFGWIGGFLVFYLCSGCTRVVLDESYGEIPDKAAFIWDVLCKEKIKQAILFPSLMDKVNEQRHISLHHEPQTMSSIAISGQPVTKENMSAVGNLAESISIVYGSTEIGPISRITIDSTNSTNFKDDMTGYPFTGIQLKVLDKELKPVPPFTRGEILVQSPFLTAGYMGAEVSSQEAFLPDGWFRTGDIGFLREDGCLFVEGRSSDAIMHGAYILYPTWLEQMLIKCPGVKEVVIVPVPDKILHHEICACVKVDETANVHPTADDIISFCEKETVLNKSSSLSVIPKYVVFCTEFPETKNGKLDRRALSNLARQELHL